MKRKISAACTYLAPLLVILLLVDGQTEMRALNNQLREKLDISQQEKDQIRSQLSLIQEQFDEISMAHQTRISQLEREEMDTLRGRIETLHAQLQKIDEAHSALSAQLQSSQQALEETQKRGAAPQKQEIVSAIEEAARKQREAEQAESLRKMQEESRQRELKVVNSVRQRADESQDAEERERLFRAADVIEQAFDLLAEMFGVANEDQRRALDQDLYDLRQPLKELAKEQIKADLARLGARFNVPPEQTVEFVEETYRVFGDPTEGGSTLFQVSTGVFSFPE